MAVQVAREHQFSPDEVEAKMNAAVEELAARNGLSVIDKAHRKATIAGMGVTGKITWDEKQITVTANMAFAFGAMDSQIRSAIEAALDHICGPAQ